MARKRLIKHILIWGIVAVIAVGAVCDIAVRLNASDVTVVLAKEIFGQDSLTIISQQFQNKRDNYGIHYGVFAGSYAQDDMGYAEDVINVTLDGDHNAYWNID